MSKIVLKNALPLHLAHEIRDAFLNTDYDRITQERKNFYAREFSDAGKMFPAHDEVYTAEFYRSRYLETSSLITNCYTDYIKPIIETNLRLSLNSYDLRVYKMLEGGHFRIHKDDYVAQYGFIWYLSREWCWDWGGLLIDIGEQGEASVTIPEFNQMVIMNHSKGLIPHCVTEVSKHAKEPRLMLVGFLT